MKEKELIEKLNSLKATPDSNWKEKNREILMSQISAGIEAPEKPGLMEVFDVWAEAIVPFDILHRFVARPVLVTALVIISLASGGVLSLQAAKNTKPGDSLYIAKIVSEKSRLALTFDEKEKAKLGVEFAGNRAKEMVAVMEEDKDDNEKTEKVEKLASDFNKELTGARGRLEKMGITAIPDGGNLEDNKVDDTIIGANLGKTDGGIQLSDPGTKPQDIPKDAPKTDIKPDDKATTTPEVKTEVKAEADTPVKILNDAQELFEMKDYGGAVNKLEEIKNIIDTKDTSLNPNATSTSDKVEMSTK